MAKIIGNTTATPYPRPDWNQTDETKADYIKNKPTILTEEDVYTKQEIDDKGFITIDNLPESGVVEETDPTVPAWAKESNKPTYKASEIEYTNESLYDQTGTVESALDEAILFVTTGMSDYAKNDTVPNAATFDGITLTVQRVDGESTKELFSVEVPRGNGSGTPRVFYTETGGTIGLYQKEFSKWNIYPDDIDAHMGDYIIYNGTVYIIVGETTNYWHGDMLVDILPVPSVTTSDNGKFLRVVNGAWSAVAIDNAEGVEF